MFGVCVEWVVWVFNFGNYYIVMVFDSGDQFYSSVLAFGSWRFV